MTSEELREIVPTDVEAWMIEDIIWPARSLCLCYDEDNWYYGTRYGKVHPDDAAAQIERRLVEWALRQSGDIYHGIGVYWINFPDTLFSGPTLLHALVAAYRSSKESKR